MGQSLFGTELGSWIECERGLDGMLLQHLCWVCHISSRFIFMYLFLFPHVSFPGTRLFSMQCPRSLGQAFLALPLVNLTYSSHSFPGLKLYHFNSFGTGMQNLPSCLDLRFRSLKLNLFNHNGDKVQWRGPHMI